MDIRKLPTGIAAFDHISAGGLPYGRTTLVAGSPGSGKTLFGAQFLALGIQLFDQPGVFVTFEEQVEDIRSNLRTLNWDIDACERTGKWVFVDASPRDDDMLLVGEYDLSGFQVRLERAITKCQAQRVVLDSIGSVFAEFQLVNSVRRELFKLTLLLGKLGTTSLLTTERTAEYGNVSRLGVEEFLTDNVIILRNVLSEEKRRRTIEILKFRGSPHEKGENLFTIDPRQAIVIIPLSAMDLRYRASSERVTSGIARLDDMCGGGFYRNSVILVSGSIGAGKTLLVTTFVHGVQPTGQRCLLLAFEESREQLFRNAAGWGQDFAALEAQGALRVECLYPEVASLEDHLLHIQALVREFRPDRIAIDSLSALSRTSTDKAFREFVIALTSFLKHQEITSLFTVTTTLLSGGTSDTEGNISPLTDTIILLRYVEISGEMHRGLSVLKMRGSRHDSAIRGFTIDDKGINIGEPFMGVSGILTGLPSRP